MEPCILYKNKQTPGIDCSIQRPTEYIYKYERNSIPTQSVAILVLVQDAWSHYQLNCMPIAGTWFHKYISFTVVYPREPMVEWFGHLRSTQKVVGSIPASANSPIFSFGVFAVRELFNVV